MCRKIFICFLSVTILNLLVGCYHFKSVSVPEYKEVEDEVGKPIEIYVKTKDGDWYHFTNSNYHIENDTLYGYGKLLLDDWEMTQKSKIAVSDIASIGIEDINSVTTGMLWGLAIFSVIGIVVFFGWLFSSDKEINP